MSGEVTGAVRVGVLVGVLTLSIVAAVVIALAFPKATAVLVILLFLLGVGASLFEAARRLVPRPTRRPQPRGQQ